MNRKARRAVKAQTSATRLDPKFVLGELTVARHGDGWIVLEDGQRVGGTLIGDPPFTSQAAARRYVKRERADYEEDLALGNFKSIAQTKFIRQTDPELWLRVEAVEKQLADDDSQEWLEAHVAAGTQECMMEFLIIGLEADGVVECDDEQPQQKCWRLTKKGWRLTKKARIKKLQ